MNYETSLSKNNFSFGKLAGHAWLALKGHWGVTIGTLLVAWLIDYAARCIFSYIQSVIGILLFPMELGMLLFFLTLVRGGTPGLGVIFKPFSAYGRALWGYLRVTIFTFLWSLLFIIPGIIAALRYSMTYYIMLDKPEYSVKQAMTESCELTYGYKWRIFGYCILWGLISLAVTVFTLGIGLLWLIPWCKTFFVMLYETLRGESILGESDAPAAR